MTSGAKGGQPWSGAAQSCRHAAQPDVFSWRRSALLFSQDRIAQSVLLMLQLFYMPVRRDRCHKIVK